MFTHAFAAEAICLKTQRRRVNITVSLSFHFVVYEG